VDYIGRIYRPPSEARSLLLQVSVGCSHNRCVYCDMYTDKQFKPKPWEFVEADLREAASAGPRSRRVFLCDGDALILKTGRLMQILEGIRSHLPWIERVGVYGDTRSVLRKSVDELRELRAAGLGIIYHGMESGDDQVLKLIDKGGTRDECIETAQRLRDADLLHSVMVLLGIGGVELSEQHARNTATALSAMDPPFVGALTTTIVPGTTLDGMARRGEFELPEKFRMLEELRILVADTHFSHCRFSANHASNYLPIQSDMPRDQRALLDLLDRVIEQRDESLLKPEGLRAL
jgi:radical SAM superfamily enzyme YgiQ (UPF0313 family)